jgi:hypothetical protein
VSIDDRIGVSEPGPPLGFIDETGPVDGAAQHCASESRHPGARRIRLPKPSWLGTDRRSSKACTRPDVSRSHRFDHQNLDQQVPKRRSLDTTAVEA